MGDAVEIKYTIAETTTYPGYTASTTDPVESGETITNTQEPVEVFARKEWMNADGTEIPPEDAKVTFTLYIDGVETGPSVVLDGVVDDEPSGNDVAGYESQAWRAQFANLPKYKVVEGEAVEIEYTIAETGTYPGYTPSTTDPVENGGTITNEQDTFWVQFKKVNSSGTPLPGATFTFNDRVASSDHTITSTEDSAGGLMEDAVDAFELAVSDDSYVLTETVAPDGYNKLADTVKVHVNVSGVTWEEPNGTGSADGSGTKDDPYVVVIQNNAGEQLPFTGGPGTALFNILGSAIATAAILTYLLLSRRASEGRSWV